MNFHLSNEFCLGSLALDAQLLFVHHLERVAVSCTLLNDGEAVRETTSANQALP